MLRIAKTYYSNSRLVWSDSNTPLAPEHVETCCPCSKIHFYGIDRNMHALSYGFWPENKFEVSYVQL